MTPAEELRAAAKHLRTLAMGAPSNGARSWRYAKGSPSDSVRTEAGWEVCYGDSPGDLRYIAAMHPGIGLAVTDWLESAAENAEQIGPDPRALAVARQLLAGVAV